MRASREAGMSLICRKDLHIREVPPVNVLPRIRVAYVYKERNDTQSWQTK